MATLDTNKSATQLLSTIATAQTVVEQFPISLTVQQGKGFSCSFDLLATIFNMVSDVPLNVMVVNFLSEKLADTNCTWLQGIEETVKMALLANITNLLGCDMMPIIPDKYIGGGEFLKGKDNAISFSGEGITIPVSAIDFTGVLGNSPNDKNNPESVMNFFSCYKSGTEIPLEINELWKHDDFNAFLWYVKHKGVYGNLTERRKLIWDNRYKSIPYTKYERKPEHFFTMSRDIDPKFSQQVEAFPFSPEYLDKYNKHETVKYKKKQILECRYIDGDGVQSDSFQFRIPASRYYKTRRIFGKTTTGALNKTIFEFNYDFLMSLKLFDAKTYLCQVISYLLGTGNISFNFSVTREETQDIEDTINAIIENIVNEPEVDDCYYTFSNEQYDTMLKNGVNRRKAAQTNLPIVQELYTELDILDNPNATLQERTTTIKNALDTLTLEGSSPQKSPNGWNFEWDYQLELLRMLVYPLIRPLFSPKVMTLLLINFELMGNPLEAKDGKISFKDVLPHFKGIIFNIALQLKDIIVEMLYSWVIDKLAPLISLFTLRTMMEQLDMYRRLITEMISACASLVPLNLFNYNKKMVGIDTVNYVDIDPVQEQLKQTAVSTTNC